jgi:hypothetical protein
MKTKLICSLLFMCLQVFLLNIQTSKAQQADTVRYSNFATAQADMMKSYEKLLAEIPELNTYLNKVVLKKQGFKLKAISKQGYYIVYQHKHKKGTQQSKLQVYKRETADGKRKLLMEVQRQQNEIYYLKLILYSTDKDSFYELSPNKFYKESTNNYKNVWEKRSYILLNINKL